MPKPMHAVAAAPAVGPTAATGAGEARRSRVAEAWRIAMAHMQLGEVPIEQLDFADAASSPPVAGSPRTPTPTSHAVEREDDDRPAPSDAEIDEEGDDSFPASDPPSWPKSHA